MKTVHEIVDILYGIINVASVTNLLDGEVYRFKKPLNSSIRDVVIRPLTNVANVDTQSPIINVNCFVPDFPAGIPDEVNLEAITDAVIAVLEAYNSDSVGTYMKITIGHQLLLDDLEQKQMSYSNLRLNCTIQT